MNPETDCSVSRCSNSVQYHVQFTDRKETYVSRTYSYCRKHTQIAWYLPPKNEEDPDAKGKWIGGWVPHNIYSIQDNNGNELNVNQVRKETRTY